MKERPILFSGPMVRAILEGRKTMTRRVCKPQPHSVGDQFSTTQHKALMIRRPGEDAWKEIPCPYGKPGDLLWVRESFAYPAGGAPPDPSKVVFAADGSWVSQGVVPAADNYVVYPSIHMPRWASRLTLRVKAVRVERLQDIGEQDAIAEGVAPIDSRIHSGVDPNQRKIAVIADSPPAWMTDARDEGPYVRTAREEFMKLWDSINAKHPWDSNPWVWAVEFEVVT